MKGAVGLVEVQGGVEGWEGFFGGGWEFGGKRVSGLRGQRVDLSMSECVSVFSRGGRGGGEVS